MKRGILTGRRKKTGQASIEMAPLIDMVFILLIFYIVSTSFVQDAGVTVERPQSNSAVPVTTRYLPVAITKAGLVYIEGSVVAPDDYKTVERYLSDAQVQRIVIQADREVPAWLLLKVLDTCKASGASGVDVAALRE